MKRLILTIIYADGQVCISRNYRLQRLGDFEWIKSIFRLSEQSLHVDEITIINASRSLEKYSPKSLEFTSFVQSVLTHTSIPLSVGGLIRDASDVDSLFAVGADRVVIRKRLGDKDFIQEVTLKYGQQSIMGWVDIVDQSFNHDEQDSFVFAEDIERYLRYICSYFDGEILLNSIMQDGTGQGLDARLLELVAIPEMKSQFIISGGMSTYEHMRSAFDHANVNAISTSNLFAQIGDSLPRIRTRLIRNGYDLADHLVSLSI